jgi:plastocyanin
MTKSRKPENRNRHNTLPQQGSGFSRRMAVGFGVGTAAMLVMVFVIWVLLGSGSGAQAAGNRYNNPQGAAYHVPGPVPSQAQLEKQAVAATMGTDGVQKADLVLDDTNSSYKPVAIKVKKGVPVRLNLSELGGSKDCRSVVRLAALGVQGFVEPGQVTSMDFTPSQAGVYEFNCPMRMVNPSYLVVTD